MLLAGTIAILALWLLFIRFVDPDGLFAGREEKAAGSFPRRGDCSPR